ncbi:MAG TPA: baseplate J/gp47 family protein [Anaerolineaceae bacterium]
MIQLESHDDYLTVCDKIAWVKSGRVLLVFPPVGKILRSRLDLLLIARYVRRLGTQLGLVTGDPEIRSDAEDMGIPVFETALQAQSRTWRRQRIRRKFKRLRPEKQPVARLEDLRSRRKVHKALPLGIRIPLFLLGLAAFTVMVLFFVPQAEVSVSPATRLQQIEFPIWADVNIKNPQVTGGIPAYTAMVIVEGRDQIPSTGTVKIPENRATGWVVFSNLTDKDVEIPYGTVVLSKSVPAVRFSTIRAVTVPAGVGREVETPIQAMEAGSQGNVIAGQINAVQGMLGLQVVVRNGEPTRSGTDRVIPAPSDLDYQQLHSRLIEKIAAQALAEFQRSGDRNRILFPDSIKIEKIIEEIREPQKDQPGESLKLTMRAEYLIRYARMDDVQFVAGSVLDAGLPQNFDAIKSSLQIRLIGTPVQEEENRYTWQTQASRQIKARASKDVIGRSTSGKTSSEAREILMGVINLNQPPDIVIKPSWWIRLPFLTSRIEVVEN